MNMLMVRWSNLMYMLSHLHTTLYAYSLYAVLNFISHAVMSIKEMFVSRCIYHFRGGWVGIAHSRSYDVFLDPAHSFFVPTPKHGGIPSVMQTDNECNTDAKQAMRRIEMQNNVMLCDIQFQDRNPLWPLSQKTSAALFGIRWMHVSDLQFWEKAAK